MTIKTFYKQGYGTPPKLVWSTTKSRQSKVEKRIIGLVNRKKPFYITIDSNEEWFVDGGNWCHLTKDSLTIGHIKNILPFLRGKNPIEWGSWHTSSEQENFLMNKKKITTKNPFKRRKR